MKDTFNQLEEERDPHVRIELLLKLCKGFLNSDLERCENAAFELLVIGKHHAIPEASMQHFLVMGRISYRRGELETSYDYFTEALGVANNIDSLKGKANCLESFGLIRNRQGKHHEALGLLMQAHEIYQTIGAHNGLLGLSYNNIANTYNYLKEPDEAEKYYRLAIEALEQSERQYSVNLIKGNLGLILFKKAKYQDAIQFLEAGLEGFIQQNNVQAQSQAYCHIANGYMALDELVKALEYFQKGLKLIRSREFPTELASIFQGLGQLYIKLNGHKEALLNLKKALAIRLDRAYWSDACETYLTLYSLYTQIGNHEKAEQMISEGLKLSQDKEIKQREAEFMALK